MFDSPAVGQSAITKPAPQRDGLARRNRTIAQQKVTEVLNNRQSTSLAEIFRTTGTITAKDVAEAAQSGDRLAEGIIESVGNRLGETIAILIDLFNPERVIVGGLGMRLGESLLAPARAAVKREALPKSAAVCQILPAELRERIGDIAALCVAMGL